MIFYGLTGIYQIRNKINDKRYIGSAVDVYARWQVHKSRLRRNIHSNHHLQNAWNKYGEENFDFQYRLLCSVERLREYEQAFLDNARCEYNIARCATATMLGRNLSESHKRKLSKAMTGKTHTKKTREKLSKMMTGKGNHRYGERCSKETRQKMSESHKGQVQWNKGKHLSDEHKKKLSEATTRYWAKKKAGEI